jgi:hypothetical protein
MVFIGALLHTIGGRFQDLDHVILVTGRDANPGLNVLVGPVDRVGATSAIVGISARIVPIGSRPLAGFAVAMTAHLALVWMISGFHLTIAIVRYRGWLAHFSFSDALGDGSRVRCFRSTKAHHPTHH